MSKGFHFQSIIFSIICTLLFVQSAICQHTDLAANYPKFFNRADSEIRLAKAKQVAEIINELALMRENFLKTGDFIEIFPTVYFHTTSLEFELILSNKIENPLEMMDLVIDFYAIYKKNRIAFVEGGIDSVEPHWKNYYKSAIEANAYRSSSRHLFKPIRMLWKVKTVINHGFVAHIDYDLEKSIGKILSSASISKESLYRDFRSSDSVMLQADSKANNDFANAFFKRMRFFAKLSINFGQQLFNVSSKILKMRLNAWKAASNLYGFNPYFLVNYQIAR